MGTSFDRYTLRKVESNQADTIRNLADPGKFKDERTWPKWEIKLENDLSTIPAVKICLIPNYVC